MSYFKSIFIVYSTIVVCPVQIIAYVAHVFDNLFWNKEIVMVLYKFEERKIIH